MPALRFTRRPQRPAAPATYGWLQAHAPAQDRALGLELELIELVQQRRSTTLSLVEAAALDTEIAQVSDQLATLAEQGLDAA